jgi:hypothetical protein
MFTARWFTAVTLGLILGALVTDGSAAASKPSLSANINGHAFKASGSRLVVHLLTTVLSITASTKSVRNNHALAIACPALDFATSTFPRTLTGCDGNYQETKLSRHPSVKTWGTVSGVTVIVNHFDGTHADGTFSGTFEVSGQGKPPAVIKKGKFSVDVING